MEKETGVIEIVYCCGVGKFKGNNKAAADLLIKNLEVLKGKCDSRHFYSLEQMSSYLKNENHGALGVIAFRNNEGIKSSGVDIISYFNLFINGVLRLDIEHAWGIQDIPFFKKYFNKKDFFYFKDYFIVSSGHSFSQRFNSADKEKWETLLIADNIRTSDIIAIDRITAEKNLPAKFETKKSRLYMTVKCHPFYLTDFLAELNQNLIKIKVVGAYKLEEMKGE